MPAFGTKHVPLLAEMFIERFDMAANQKSYVGTKLMPVVDVEEQTAKYYTILKEHLLLKRPDMRRSVEGTFPEISISWSMTSYSTDDRGIEFRLDDYEKKLYGNTLNLEMRGAAMLNAMHLEDHEADVITAVNAVTPTAASALWTVDSTDIIGDVEAALNRLDAKFVPIDREKLILVVPRLIWLAMKKNVGLLETFGSSERKDSRTATLDRVADILEVGSIHVCNAKANRIAPAAPGPGTLAASAMWTSSKVALVCVGDGSASGTDIRWGNTLHWTGGPPRFDRYLSANKTSELMRQRVQRGLHTVCSDAIEVISSAAA